ncbi:MAG: SAM-dependent methyltransferase [Alphaproteobacteria bacterium]
MTGSILRERIGIAGPLPVEAFMAEAVASYYARGQAFGTRGDFITAPEVSQIFGELIGMWAAVVWMQMGRPERLRLVELGPGRGTLMADLLRAARSVAPFAAALDVHLVETSPALMNAQRHGLGGHPATWHQHFDTVPGGPAIVIANEFFDALPIRQFARTPEGWRERLVDWDGAAFRFVLGEVVDAPPLPPGVIDSPPGAIAETSPAGRSLAATLGRRLATEGGAALVIDYGPARAAAGDSLQAVRRHAFHPPLEAPGEADLTAHVDFESLALAAAGAGARPDGPLAQGPWLERLGLGARAAVLMANATPHQAADIAAAVRRLVHDEEMGGLFKVLGLAHPELPTLPGFEP